MYRDIVGRHLLPGRIFQGRMAAGPTANATLSAQLGVVHGGQMRAHRFSVHFSAEVAKSANNSSTFEVLRGADVLCTFSNKDDKITAGAHFFDCDWTETLFEGNLLTFKITTPAGGVDLSGTVILGQVELQPA